jgi:hypothetical protein
MIDNSEFFVPEFDLGRFRHMVARYVRLLIRARLTSEPGFLSHEDLERWDLADIDRDPLPGAQLAAQAAATLGLINTEFIPRCGSGGFPLTDQLRPEGRLICEVAMLAMFGGGSPHHNSDLLNAAEKLHQGQKVNWEELVNWSRLPVIRADLDLLPQPSRSSSPGPNQTDIGVLGKKNVFRRKGKSWTITYQGETVGLPDSVGLFYIHQLIEQPAKPIGVTDLKNAHAVWCTDPSSPLRKRKGGAIVSCDRDSGDDTANDELHSPGRDLGEEIDSAERAELARRIKEYDVSIPLLKAQGKIEQAKEQEEERRYLEKRLKSSRIPRGGTRKVASASGRVRRSVCGEIRRGLNKLRATHHALYDHLSQSLTIKAYCCYSPVTPTSWNE